MEANNVPKIGMTGLYYCGKKLDYKCKCCNGFCGPTSGCNCTSCKKIDRLHLKPHKGTTGKYYCGRKILKCFCCNGHCGPTNGCNCNDCQRFQQIQELKNSFIKDDAQNQKKSYKKENSYDQLVQGLQYVSEIKNKHEQSKVVELKKAQSQLVQKKDRSEDSEFKKQLQELSLSQNTIDILLSEEINGWQILRQLTKQDLHNLKIKFGDIVRILAVFK